MKPNDKTLLIIIVAVIGIIILNQTGIIGRAASSSCTGISYVETHCTTGEKIYSEPNTVCTDGKKYWSGTYTTVPTGFTYIKNCPTTCISGCTDTDGGDVPNVKGTLTSTTAYATKCEVVTFTDTCQGNDVMEHHCASSGSGYGSGIQSCPNGCSNGACTISGTTCDVYHPENCQHIGATCMGARLCPDTVVINAQNFCAGTDQACSNGCTNGACISQGVCGGICRGNACGTYTNCAPLTGTCSSGNCCSGTCTSGGGGTAPQVTFNNIDTQYVFSNSKINIVADMNFASAGTYIIEAGSKRQTSILQSFFPNLGYITSTNYCNPDQTWYANEPATVTANTNYATSFNLIPNEGSGTYNVWVEACDKCGTLTEPPHCTTSPIQTVSVSTTCSCGSWTEQGIDSCTSDGKMRSIRTCTPANCQAQEEFVANSECPSGGGTTCPVGQKQYFGYEIINGDCSIGVGACSTSPSGIFKYNTNDEAVSACNAVLNGDCINMNFCSEGGWCGSDDKCHSVVPKTNCDGDPVKGIGASCFATDGFTDSNKITSECITGICRDLKSNSQGAGVCDQLVCCKFSEIGPLGTKYRYVPKAVCSATTRTLLENYLSMNVFFGLIPGVDFVWGIAPFDSCKVDSKFSYADWEEAQVCAEELSEANQVCEDYQYLYQKECQDRKKSVAENNIGSLSFERTDLTSISSLINPENNLCLSNKMCENKVCKLASNDDNNRIGSQIYQKFVQAVDEDELKTFVKANEIKLKSELGMTTHSDPYENYGICLGSKIPFDACTYLSQINLFNMEDSCVGGGIVAGGGALLLFFLYGLMSKPPKSGRRR
jgi:hypothetical protein